LFNEENDSIAKAMVSFYEAEQVKKKLFIAIQFDSHWALAQKQSSSPSPHTASIPGA